MGGSASHIHLRFATISLIVVFVIGALLAVAAIQLTRSSEESESASTAERIAAAPIATIIGGDIADGSMLSDDRRAAVDAFAAPLIGESVKAVRIWTPEGVRLYSAGVPAGEGEATIGGPGQRTAGDGSKLFATYVRGDGFVIEVGLDAHEIEGKIASQTQNALLIDIGAMVLLFVVLQMVFWSATHGIAADHRRLERLYVTGEDLRASLDLHDVVTQVVRQATDRGGGSHGLIALYEHETGDLVLRATYERDSGDITHHQRSVEEWFLRRAVATSTTVVSSQSSSAYEPFFGPDASLDEQINVICAPMRIRDRVVGVVGIVKPPVARGAAFSPEEIRETNDLAIQGAVAVEQALLFAKVRAYADEVELSYDATLKALMAALDAKDDVTEGHCERVARLTVSLAKQLGLPESSLVDIERGAMLHDVGKIGVPDAVLKKPAALDDMEWEAIRKHPLLAGMMISKVGFLEGTTPILLYHHERFDGAGYPFGLMSDRIPLEARLFSVVDAYDAMTSNRPYRQAMPHAAAMDEIHAGSGTQFDPAIVDVFARMMSDHPELRARLLQSRGALHTDLATDAPAA